MNVLFITNIPAPYRIDFYNELGKSINLTVIFEAKGAEGINFNWNIDEIKYFKAIFLNEGNIKEKRVDWKIFKYLNEKKYDHIVITNYSYFTEMAALIYMKIKRIPYYFETDGGLIRKENIIKRYYKKFLVSNAKGYFSPSKSSDEYLIFYGALKNRIFRYPFTSLKSKNILNDTCTKEEKIELRKLLGIKEKFVILAVGQFIHRKGFDILLKACKNLEDDVGVYIIGGKITKEYLDIIKEFKFKNIYFEEFKTNHELQQYYKSADVFILPTREDIWGLVINEAMANGLPIITTNACVAGLELVNNNKNGFIINTNDEIELLKKIQFLLKNTNKLKSMQRESLNNIRNYTIEGMVQAHLNVFNQK